LVSVCLRSLKASLGDLRAKFWVLLDGCPEQYEDVFRDQIAPEDLILLRLGGIGNHATFSRQIDILLQQDDATLVYFAEDDYFYVSGQFPEMVEFLRSSPGVDFVSPYDHPDCYTLDLHGTPKWIRPYGGRHWRTAASTCLTFLTKRETLSRCESVFRSYARGNKDCSLWLSLTKQRVFDPLAFVRYLAGNQIYWRILAKAWFHCSRQILFGHRWRLWVPMPGIATHLDKNALSPTINWLELMRESAELAYAERIGVHEGRMGGQKLGFPRAV
jgi:hypothetical protein